MLGTLARCLVGASFVAGCASAPSLDDAKLTGISLLSPEDQLGRAKSRWPTLRLTFQSDRPLFDHDTTPPRVQFEICEASGDERHLYGFGLVEVTWQGQPITEAAVFEIQSLDQPQEYEVEFDYVYWEDSQNRSRPDSVTLLPLPGDLCIAFRKSSKPLPPSIGRPLRVNRDTVNETVGPLPRLISIP